MKTVKLKTQILKYHSYIQTDPRGKILISSDYDHKGIKSATLDLLYQLSTFTLNKGFSKYGIYSLIWNLGIPKT